MEDEQYMDRCIQLASLGSGNVAPNPMVGAVLVNKNRIIGEGYHQFYGKPHAEVNCINSVKENDKHLMETSTLYVSLEPCVHFGKTPPCANLIIAQKIKRVVIGCADVYEEVAGKGVAQLKAAGVDVKVGVLENECIALNKRFFTFHNKKRPFIVLKWAQSINAGIGSVLGDRVLISNDYSNRLVHKWRSEEAAILVGTTTALRDNPSLTTRFWTGKNPVRLAIDRDLKLPGTLKIFDGEVETIVFNSLKEATEKGIKYIKLENKNFLNEMVHSLFELNIQSVLVEGGAKTLQTFINNHLWDEARVIVNEQMVIENGVLAPELKSAVLINQQNYLGNLINYYKSTN